MIEAENSTRYTRRLLMIGASFLLGGLRITCGSTGSTPSDWLGGPIFVCAIRLTLALEHNLR